MGKMNDITISNNEYRPCYVKNKKALFHKWIEIERNKMTVIVSDLKETYGLVEFEDGQVMEVIPSEICFCDNKLSEYYFDKEIEKGEK